MLGFVIGVAVGITVAFILTRPKHSKGSHRMPSRKKVDGIWTARDERQKNPVDPSRPRVRRALILERTRRG